jgi:hypothetical protein
MKTVDQQSANRFAEKRIEAEEHLWREMEARGFHRKDGWKMGEFLRDTRGGTELVLRPIHLWHPTPPELECVIWVSYENGDVNAQCTPELPGP